MTIQPSFIRLEASTLCQLNCPSCPQACGEIEKGLGAGFLKFSDFKQLIDDNPCLASVELSNWGEIFLNPQLPQIVKYSFDKGVALTADNGVNLNTVSEEMLEALVQYKFRSLACSIDGASPETYALYRRNGSLPRVLGNIQKINQYKAKHQSPYPVLTWRFIVFGHNEEEISAAKQRAKELHMEFRLKLSWEDLYGEAFSPVKNKELVRKATGIGIASRAEYKQKMGRSYIRDCCTQLWRTPQLNYDGRVLGCCINYWGDYGNAFQDGLLPCLNSEKMNCARDMLSGNKQTREDVPCTKCKIYQSMKEENDWLKPDEIEAQGRIFPPHSAS
jgi:MoaA/NifB/PqqE/SkfB family radical SAM enzyme